ncbi:MULTISPECIES: sigma-54-dependent transcriptional regulator [Sphingobacterium]|jgi:two-component system nitrogen regulation response regulator NtrX|uniref:sigma-54-dependent transcriptional regulator n=1 Tax=Sphingobacterium TaxID=28453 RepID=UPI0004E5F9F3|nr:MULTISPECIES: sigma-54 dependent transcriptional regulator [Sphingobacterium]CDS91692.1 Transcriptional regulatory protein ZraR [Sphingobacterium sp. PM2-P1-29]SJN48841.1 Sigma-54 dependent transcriptional regulator/response regulator [Sphingobacterium faecium PCAi_F2.5]UPZ36652.1 sigma-54 dependent transcriptional regulator [Sphingobacterium sp. PCS056]UXD68169.1 sigma-54 dependent transcriptional regulator [Sphingobacterium faecium]WGQ15880.1 sigma-54 dependent transcriptional regulator [
MSTILIIDDERAIRNSLRDILEYEDYNILDVDNGSDGLEIIKKEKIDLVLCDIKMNKMDGMEVLATAQKINPDLPFIMISGHGTIETAVEAAKKGAFDFLEKPLDLNRLLITVRNGLEKVSLVTETKVLKRKVTSYKTKEILGKSEAISRIKETIDRVAPTEARVLITGANGAGKELVARWIHEKSNRAEGPLIEVNCAAIPSELIESELFGHEKGSFTSAIKQRLGKFELATNGTLFLDEIGDMSLSAQAKVLRALQEHKITRVGGDKEIDVNVRVVAATNKNLFKEIDAGNFRMDLYHRLSVILIHVPSLTERVDDIPLLSKNFCEEICNEYGVPVKEITAAALKELCNLPWTGNIRELRNMIERLIILSDKSITDRDVIAFANPSNTVNAISTTSHPSNGASQSNQNGSKVDLDNFASFQDFKDFAEKEFIKYKLEKNTWNVSKTADDLDIQRSHLYSKIEKFGLKRD